MSNLIQSTNPLLPDIFALHGKWRASKPAVVSDDETLNWKAFNTRINQVAHGLSEMGLKKGDRVIVLMSNGLPMMECLFGIMMGGFVSAPLNVSVSDDAIANMINDSQAKAIIATPEHCSRLEAMANALPGMANKNRICTGPAREGWKPYKAWRDTQPNTRPDTQIDPDDYLNIIYSSGTTGQPKGIVHTHRGRRDWAYDLSIALRYNSGSRFLVTIGLYSNITWVGLLCTMLAGGTVLINGKFDAETLWQKIEAENITHLSMVPVMYERMMAVENAGYDASSMQGMMSAGSPLRKPVKSALFERFSCGIIELYGLTEGVITTLDPEDAADRLSSVGLPLIGTDLKILDDSDSECPSGKAGEIVANGRIVMPEYFNRPDATRAAQWIDSDGVHWLRTGDIGYLDEMGYLYIVDRKKDMILSGGQNIYPQDIETVLLSHEDIQDAAVIGVKSEKWGETPLAIIVPKIKNVDAESLRIWTNNQLGKQQRITGVDLIDEIPRNPNGKILKRELRESYKGRVFD
ncbi:acyl-CoA synthetase (AMP-forming)/AMP-acid ligase II [Litorimonas taeanensis]|uniref:Acyl-CoA synthetase (AMP-forming)/AMP-acid ligase II n=1 Tax=Litorimonas taeanensis TaxID=568099 RepID=A0A420WLF8_9PROT|nr:AMP-binding protein [Litorimonas taeanensis]RKQ71881.1 acyl-CoA synthetase (AMP-forming)/AMP-acid ligase II [Litorimonas taeanensis]